jgi:hypothetical protein
MIWGKTAKVCSTARGMDNGVPTDSEGGFVQVVTDFNARRCSSKMQGVW